MPSYAQRVRSNQDLRSAARSLGLRPSQVSSRRDLGSVRQEARRLASARTASSSAGSAAAPRAAAVGSYAPGTVGGSYVSSGINTISDWMGRAPGNETIAAMGYGTLFDIGRTQVDTGLAIAYNDAFLGSLGNYQSGQENLRTANASKLMAQEGAIARDLADMTSGRALEGVRYGYDSQERQIGLAGREDRQTLAKRGLEERKMRADARGAIRSQGARFYG